MKQNVFKVFFAISILCVSHLAFTQSRIGTLDEVKQDDGFLIIDGIQITYRGDVLITYKEEPVRTTILSPGLRVNYTVHADGSIKSIRLLGPIAQLEDIDQH